MAERGAYVADPTKEAGRGWCEANVTMHTYNESGGGRHCLTFARFERDGHPVCGLHVKAGCPHFRETIVIEDGEVWCFGCDKKLGVGPWQED